MLNNTSPDTSTDITDNTTAETAASIYLEKLKKIELLRYECDLLVEKYYSEMRKAVIPFFLNEISLQSMFDADDEKKSFRREIFLKECFSGDFLKTHKVEFNGINYLGYGRIAIIVVLLIGDYLYEVTIPIPKNIVNEQDKKNYMGKVKFRVDRIHNSKTDEFVKEYKTIQMPTYDWNKCFIAIEADVNGVSGA